MIRLTVARPGPVRLEFAPTPRAGRSPRWQARCTVMRELSRLAPVRRRVLILARVRPRARRLRRQDGRARAADGRRQGSDDAAGEGRPGRGQAGLRDRRLQELPHAEGRRRDRDRRAEPRPGEAARRARRRAGDEREGRRCRRSAASSRRSRSPDVAAYVVQATSGLILPDGFPREIGAIACDLDRTLIWKDAELTAADARRAPRRAIGGWDPRPPRHRADVPVGAPLRDPGRDRGPGRLLPGSGRRRARLGTLAPPRADPARARARGDRRGRRPRAIRSTATSATSSTSPSTRPRPRRTRRSSTSRCMRSATSSPGSTEPPTKLVAVGDPVELDGLEERMRRPLRRAHVHLEVAAVLPRVREPGGDEGVGARVRRRASRVHRGRDGRLRRRRERRPDARVGRATASRSRTRTSACWRSPTSSARPCDEEGVAQVIEAYLARVGTDFSLSHSLPPVPPEGAWVRLKSDPASGGSRLRRVIDLRAARNDPDSFRAALARKGAAETFDALLEADERWRELVPRVRRAARPAEAEGQADAGAARGAEALKAELQRARGGARRSRGRARQPARAGAEPARPLRSRRRHRGGRRGAAPRRRARASPSRRALRRSAASRWSAPRGSPARASATCVGDTALLELALYRFALDRP